MIQAVSDTCSVRWTKVNHKVYKFQSLVFHEDKNQIEVKSVNTAALTSRSVNNTKNNKERQINQVKQITNQQEDTIACPRESKITGPIQWKEVYGEYLGKEPVSEFEIVQGSPKVTRKSTENPAKITRKSSESPLLRQRKDIREMQMDKEIIAKKDQRRVHFEDEVRVKCEDEDGAFEQPRKNCLRDCSLCRSIQPRDISPPYQALVETSRHSDLSHEEEVD